RLPSATCCPTCRSFLSRRLVSTRRWRRPTRRPTAACRSAGGGCWKDRPREWLPVSLVPCGLGSLRRFPRHRHDDRGRVVRSLDELDLLDHVGPLRLDRQVADLLAPQGEGELRAGHVHAADVVGELLAVLQLVLLRLAV